MCLRSISFENLQAAPVGMSNGFVELEFWFCFLSPDRSFAHSVARVLDPSISRSIIRSLDRTLDRTRPIAGVRDHVDCDHSIVRTLSRSLDRSLRLSIARCRGLSKNRAREDSCMCIHMCMYICVYNIHTHINMVCMCMCMYIHTYMYIQTHM